MKVVVDATSLLLRSAGIKNYTYHWLSALRATQGPSNRAEAFPFLGDLGELKHDGSNLGKLGTVPRLGALYLANLAKAPALDWVLRDADYFHCSNQIQRPPSKTPLTATIHDLTCWLTPQFHSEENIAADKRFAEQVWKNAKGLIAVSENTKQDAVKHLGLYPSKIRVVHSGVAPHYFDARRGFHERPYFLFVGTIEPRKNLNLLMDAFLAIRPELKLGVDLVIAGPPGWKSDDVMKRLAEGVRGVRHLGYVPEAKMPGLMAAALALVYPSLYEGFGFPVAQAMAARVPVITSDNSCLPEIAGDGAIYVDPRSQSNLTKAMELMIENEDLRERLAAAGRKRAERYRWEKCARESWKFFEDLQGE